MVKSYKFDENRNKVHQYHDIGPKERVFESDSEVFERLKRTCFEYQGRWKSWIPFYGVTNVEEVQVSYSYPGSETSLIVTSFDSMDSSNRTERFQFERLNSM